MQGRVTGKTNELVFILAGPFGRQPRWPVSRAVGQADVSSREPYLLPALDEPPTRWISRRFFRCFGHTSLQALNISGALAFRLLRLAVFFAGSKMPVRLVRQYRPLTQVSLGLDEV